MSERASAVRPNSPAGVACRIPVLSLPGTPAKQPTIRRIFPRRFGITDCECACIFYFLSPGPPEARGQADRRRWMVPFQRGYHHQTPASLEGGVQKGCPDGVSCVCDLEYPHYPSVSSSSSCFTEYLGRLISSPASQVLLRLLRLLRKMQPS